MKYTQIPVDTFQNIQLNAGIIVDSFTPATGVIGNLLGATSGGIQFADEPEYIDFGEDIDNCPKNMKELKKLDSHNVTMSGNFVTVSASSARRLAAAADIDPNDATHVVPRNDLADSDFDDIWWIGDYSDKNTGVNAGFCAIHMMNALNTGGFKIQSTDKQKGQFAFNFMGHYSMANQDQVPFEVFVKQGTNGTETPSVLLNNHAITIEAGESETLTATVVPAGQTITWASASSSVASVSGGVVTAGESAGNTIITASITVDGVTYSDTCTVVVAE